MYSNKDTIQIKTPSKKKSIRIVDWKTVTTTPRVLFLYLCFCFSYFLLFFSPENMITRKQNNPSNNRSNRHVFQRGMFVQTYMHSSAHVTNRQSPSCLSQWPWWPRSPGTQVTRGHDGSMSAHTTTAAPPPWTSHGQTRLSSTQSVWVQSSVVVHDMLMPDAVILVTIPAITVILVPFFISLIIKGGVMNTPFGGYACDWLKIIILRDGEH